VEPAHRRAVQALQSGDLATAEHVCRGQLAANPSHTPTLQLLAVVLRRLDRLDEAESLMRRCVAADPHDPDHRSNLGQLLAARGKPAEGVAELERAAELAPEFRPARLALARLANQTGQHALAEKHARRLIAFDDRDSEAWSALGTALNGLQRADEAATALRRAVTIAPRYASARQNLASLLAAEEHSAEALAQIAECDRIGIRHRSLEMARARALMQLDQYDASESVLVGMVEAAPDDLEAQFLLSQLRHIRGDPDFARSIRAAAERRDAQLAVRMAYADTMRRSGATDIAEALLRDLISRHGPRPELLSSLGTVLQESGHYAEAVTVARTAAESQPDDATAAENMVAALLSAGDARGALPTIERFRIRAPQDQRWITYRADVARHCDESLFDEWCDMERLVRAYDVPPPPGFSSMADFHAVLRPALEARHRQKLHPLDQSFRFGTQTSRGLLTDDDPVIRTCLSSFSVCLAEYQAEIGHAIAHPFLARNTAPARLAGCWSVRLRRDGFHVNHIHPQGWISSAYYVTVPAEAEDESLKNGWIKFGEPLHPMPQGRAGRFIQPCEGRLVLFPSYLWHGTIPIRGDAPRMSIAFDAVPAS
jgi:Flp pilus assembly protein TadD